MKLLEKLKKWIAGLTAVSLLVAFAPQTAFANTPAIPSATPGTGIYSSAQSVTLAVSGIAGCTTYTTNGDVPSGSSTKYTGVAIPIDGANGDVKILKAVSYDNAGCSHDKGPVMTATYTFDKAAPVIGGVENGHIYTEHRTVTITDVDPAPISKLNGVDFTGSIHVSENGPYTVTAEDHYGHVSTPVHFHIDMDNPIVTLTGANPLTIERGSVFVDPGFIATDAGSEVTKTTSGHVHSDQIGEYEITYTATDEAGHSSHKHREVRVRDTIPPTVDAGTDKLANEPVLQEITVADGPSGEFKVCSIEWLQLSGPGTVTFSFLEETEDSNVGCHEDEHHEEDEDEDEEHEHDKTKALLSADLDGVYVIQVTVTDEAGNEATDTMILTWDKTAPVIVWDSPALVTGSGFIDLHWKNEPVDPHFDRTEIYRSTVSGVYSDTPFAIVPAGTNTYLDESVVNGTTYYYVLKGIDSLGNEGPETPEMSATPTAPSAPTILTPIGGGLPPAEEGEVLGTSGGETLGTQSGTEQEVKGGDTNENSNDENGNEDQNSRMLSWFGIGLLALLALVGLYLLYLQNPGWFGWLFFWRRRKDKEKK